ENTIVASNGVTLADSNAHSSSNIIISDEIGKIVNTEVNSGSELVNDNLSQLDDIPVDSNNAITEEDKYPNGEKAPSASSGLNCVWTQSSSRLSLVYTNIESNTTELLHTWSSTITFHLLDDSPQNNTIRLLKQLNLTEDDLYTGDLSKIPNLTSFNQLRNLDDDSFETPIQFTYSVFKINVWGFNIAIDTWIDAGINQNHTDVTILLRWADQTIEVINYKIESTLGRTLNNVLVITHKFVKLIEKISDVLKNKRITLWQDIAAKLKIVMNTWNIPIDLSSIFNKAFSDLIVNIKSFSGEWYDSLSVVINSNENQWNDLSKTIEDDKSNLINGLILQIEKEYTEHLIQMTNWINRFNDNCSQLLINVDWESDKITEISYEYYSQLQYTISQASDVFPNFVDNSMSSSLKAIDDFNTLTKDLQLQI
ncbi:MAG: hypothetical protein ACRC42_02115, partial [Mycoplasma sp.]